MTLSALIFAIVSVLTLWTAGAIYYDVCSGSKWGRLVTPGWIGGVLLLFVAWRPVWRPFATLLGVETLFIGWWLRQKPSHDRPWDPSVAVLPRAVRDGDAVTIKNVRNFDYPSPAKIMSRYETRTVRLTNLRGLDVIFFNWGSPWMSHPVLVFDFGPDGRVCVSIEVRYRKGQDYSVLRSIYRQQELIFLVADERDVILRRTKHAPVQEALLYRLKATPDEVRSTFLDYVGAINGLCETPRWYNGLCANCTTSFYRLPGRRFRYDWRVLANGRLDEALYEDGRLDRSLPFPDLRRAARVNDIAIGAPEEGFGDYIRRELERRRHDQ
jgi:hypothetical protein